MFCPKSWVDPFGKVAIFILCQKDICIAHKAIFSEYQQIRSLRSLTLTVFDKNDELTAFEKLAFSVFVQNTLLFPKRPSFLSRISMKNS